MYVYSELGPVLPQCAAGMPERIQPGPEKEIPRISEEIRGLYLFYTMPWAFMASATFRKPAMLAPAT